MANENPGVNTPGELTHMRMNLLWMQITQGVNGATLNDYEFNNSVVIQARYM